jgi:hypothetical protein
MQHFSIIIIIKSTMQLIKILKLHNAHFKLLNMNTISLKISKWHP